MAETVAVDGQSPPAEAVGAMNGADPHTHTSSSEGIDTSTVMADVAPSMPAVMSAPEAFVPQDLAMQHNPVTSADARSQSFSNTISGEQADSLAEVQSHPEASNNDAAAPALSAHEGLTNATVEESMDHEPTSSVSEREGVTQVTARVADEERLPDYGEATAGGPERQMQPNETSLAESTQTTPQQQPSSTPVAKITFDGTSKPFSFV